MVAINEGLKPLALNALFGTTEETAEKLRFSGKTGEIHPSGAKARHYFVAFAARLKPCPFKTTEFSAACKVVP
jgi:hypothetical protein